MFYAGAPFVVKGYAYRNYDYDVRRRRRRRLPRLLRCRNRAAHTGPGRRPWHGKPELEFFDVAEVGYTVCPGDDPLITERILAIDPDTGIATRILRYEPGTDTTPNGVQDTTSGRRSTSSKARSSI